MKGGRLITSEIKRLTVELRAPQPGKFEFRNLPIGAATPPAEPGAGKAATAATPAPPPAPAPTGPVIEREFRGFKFRLLEAVAQGPTLVVTVQAVNSGTDREVTIGDGNSPVSFYDNEGKLYATQNVTIGNQRMRAEILNGVPTRVTLRFEKLPTVKAVLEASQVVRLTLGVALRENNEQVSGKIEFRNVAIKK